MCCASFFSRGRLFSSIMCMITHTVLVLHCIASAYCIVFCAIKPWFNLYSCRTSKVYIGSGNRVSFFVPGTCIKHNNFTAKIWSPSNVVHFLRSTKGKGYELRIVEKGKWETPCSLLGWDHESKNNICILEVRKWQNNKTHRADHQI